MAREREKGEEEECRMYGGLRERDDGERKFNKVHDVWDER